MAEMIEVDVLDIVAGREDTPRVADLRRRVRDAMESEPAYWSGPERIDDRYMSEPLPVRKARAMALKLAPDAHRPLGGPALRRLDDPGTARACTMSAAFPIMSPTRSERRPPSRGLTIRSVFGHIVPDYPRLLRLGLRGHPGRGRGPAS